jgi:hypothetical protein
LRRGKDAESVLHIRRRGQFAATMDVDVACSAGCLELDGKADARLI